MSAHRAILPIANGREVRRVLARLFSRHRARSCAAGALLLLANVLGLVLPLALGRIVDAVVRDAGPAAIGAWVLGAAAGAIAAALVGLWGTRVLVGLVQETLAALREEVFASAMSLPVAEIDDGESADLISRVTGDVEAVAEAGGDLMPTLLSALFAIAVSLVSLAAIDVRLALAGLASLPCYAIGTRIFLRRSRVVFREVREREAARSQAVLEAVEGRETLTALGEEGHAIERVAERARASIRTQIVGARLRNRLFFAINGGEAIGMVALLATGFALSGAGAVSVGMVTAAALVFHRLFGPIGQLIFGLDDIQRATIGLARLVGVIEAAQTDGAAAQADTAAEPASTAAEPAGTADTSAAVALDAVTFHYPRTGRGVDAVTLRIAAGTTAAFVGASGSGKSTLAKLIAGQYAPDSGRLRTAAEPYTISQELHQFRGGIAANLTLAAPDADPEQLRAALAAVGADWALAALDREDAGADAESWDEGRIQQLAIARALLADPAIVILDEPTAEVGLQARPAVDAAIARVRRGRTAVLIAHQLGPVVSAEQIVVFAEGRAVQRGAHEELVRAPGPYRELWAAQARTEPPAGGR
ncbi:ABC transporter ATP-binding protein [Leucobacter sp. PH1c]|uniref:ABC transporter ATP-binding protein n=1 Tax=Leucobacter sp. PH1c TaxID=1397278 RepID=UPI0004A7D714|nr:ABC transporter ATP-binding protein [Leucobacter sp. PH1c]